jgi:hypothetical protein
MAATVAALTIAISLTGAGASKPADEHHDTSAADPSCMTIGDISSQTVIDDQHLLLRAGPDRLYLLTTRDRCSGMRPGERITLSFNPDRPLCRPDEEHVTPPDGWRCAIADIEPVESEDAARAQASARRDED